VGRIQIEQEEGHASKSCGRGEEGRVHGYRNGYSDRGDIHRDGECSLNHCWANVEKPELRTDKEGRGPAGSQQLEKLHGEDDTTASTRPNVGAPNSWTSHKPVANLGSLRGGTVAGHDEVDPEERAVVGCPP